MKSSNVKKMRMVNWFVVIQITSTCSCYLLVTFLRIRLSRILFMLLLLVLLEVGEYMNMEVVIYISLVIMCIVLLLFVYFTHNLPLFSLILAGGSCQVNLDSAVLLSLEVYSGKKPQFIFKKRVRF